MTDLLKGPARGPDGHVLDCRNPGMRTTGLPNSQGRRLYVCRDDACAAVAWRTDHENAVANMPPEWLDKWGQPIMDAYERGMLDGRSALRVTFPVSSPGGWHRESVREGWTICGLDFAAYKPERPQPGRESGAPRCGRCWNPCPHQ